MSWLTSRLNEDFRDYAIAALPRLIRTAYLLTGNLHDAEDLTQATLVKLAVVWGRVVKHESPDGYARRVMTNLHISAWRRRRNVTVYPVAAVPDRATDGEHAAGEDWELLRVALLQLPARQRAAVVLRFYNDLSVHDTAAAMGCSAGTVKALTHHGLNRLRTELKEELIWATR